MRQTDRHYERNISSKNLKNSLKTMKISIFTVCSAYKSLAKLIKFSDQSFTMSIITGLTLFLFFNVVLSAPVEEAEKHRVERAAEAYNQQYSGQGKFANSSKLNFNFGRFVVRIQCSTPGKRRLPTKPKSCLVA